MSVAGYKFTELTGGGPGAMDAADGTNLNDGDLAIVMTGGLLYHYQLSAASGAVAAPPAVIAPIANAGAKRWLLQRVPAENAVPVGTIVAFVGGYFANGANGGFVNVIGNSAAAVNARVNADGWYVGNGAYLNLPGSPIFGGAGRYLPNLTDNRFLVGSAGAGTIGGSNDSTHQHNYDHAHNTSDFTLTETHIPSHIHSSPVVSTNAPGAVPVGPAASNVHGNLFFTGAAGGGQAHNHNATYTVAGTYGSAWTGNSTVGENRPLFLSCFYLIKVI